MAALNTLRTKGGVVLAVVIGVSLLAFLLGDLSQSTLMGSTSMDVGVIDGDEITLNEYSQEIEKLTLAQQMLTGADAQGEEQINAIRNQSWDKIIRKYLFSESLENLGLLVSDDESVDMVSGEFISPVIASIFTDATGGYDHAMVRNFAASIDYDATGRSAAFWNFLSEEMELDRSYSKYYALIDKAIYTTDLEVEQYVSALANSSTIEFATKSLYSVADSLVTVTDSDLKTYYNTHKEQFKQVESRDLEYVLFESLPSEKDYAAAQEEITNIAIEFSNAENIEQFVNLNSNSPYDPIYRRAGELSTALATFIFSDEAKKGELYGPALVGDLYTLAKLVDIKTLPDTIGAKHILLPIGSDAVADSIATVLKKDRSKFAELASQFSMDQNANMNGGDLGVFPFNMMVADFAMPIAQAKKGDILTLTTQFGLHVVEVTEVGEKFPKAQIATIEYSVDPSNETNQINYSKASDFAAKVAVKGSDFDLVASELGVSKRVARLRAGERALPGISGSAEIARWVFSNKAGSVSSVISIGEQNFIVRVVNSIDHGYTPFDVAKADFIAIVRNEKKADYLRAQIAGSSDLAAIAEKFGTEVAHAEDVNFRSFFVSGLGMAPKVVGAVSAMKVGETSALIESSGSVSVVKVTGQEATENVNKESEKVLLESTAQNSFQQRVISSVYLNSDVVDNRIKFF